MAAVLSGVTVLVGWSLPSNLTARESERRTWCGALGRELGKQGTLTSWLVFHRERNHCIGWHFISFSLLFPSSLYLSCFLFFLSFPFFILLKLFLLFILWIELCLDSEVWSPHRKFLLVKRQKQTNIFSRLKGQWLLEARCPDHQQKEMTAGSFLTATHWRRWYDPVIDVRSISERLNNSFMVTQPRSLRRVVFSRSVWTTVLNRTWSPGLPVSAF